MHREDHPLRADVVCSFLDRHAQPLLFVTVSGAHLYGFESPDSDYDLRGCHITAARDVLSLDPPDETVEVMDKSGPVEMDIVTHDARKYFTLLLKNNGYVLEQVFSPLVVWARPEFEELRHLARGCITRHQHYHFFNFAFNQWKAVSRLPTVKGLLYTYRVLLAGTHLLRTGQVESHLGRLNAEARLPQIDDLVARKMAGAEKQQLREGELAFHEGEYLRLSGLMEAARDSSSLPERATTRRELSDLLVRLRLGNR